MTLKRNFPEIPASLDTAFLYRSNSPDYSFFLLLDLCFVVVMKIILSPVFPLCSQEKLGRSLNWHSRLSCVSWLCGQKPCSHGPTRLSFLPLLSPVCLGQNNGYADKIQTGCCLKENKNSPQPQSVSLSLFPVSSSLFSGLHFLRLVCRQQREKQAKSLMGFLGINSWLECGASNTKVVGSISRWAIPLWVGLVLVGPFQLRISCDLEIKLSSQ